MMNHSTVYAKRMLITAFILIFILIEISLAMYGKYITLSCDEICKQNNTEMITHLQNLGASESLIKSCQKFLDFCAHQ